MAYPKADDYIAVGSCEVLRFHPLHKKVSDGIPRCISCGQIDEGGFHDSQWCPAAGGYLPFATSKVKITLRSPSYRCDATAELTVPQWSAFNAIMAGGSDVTPALVKQIAQAIEARRAETGTGSVHESVVPTGCAPTPSSESHS